MAQLISVRSQLAEEVCRYCTRLIDKLDRTPWFRQERNIRASDVAVPVRVLKECTRPEPSRFEHERAEEDSAKPREREPSRDYVDPEIAALYEEATLEKRKEEVPWLQERAQVRRAIVLGGPGSGKTFLTQTTGLALAGAALDGVRERRTGLEAVSLPIHLTLASFARPDLPSEPAAAVLELLRDEWSPAPCLLSWFEERLRSASTWLLLDALDEVLEDHRPALSARLRAIDSQGWQTRLLLTCRPANWARELIPWRDLTEYELAPLNPLEIRQFVQRRFASDRARSDTLVHAVDRSYTLAHAARTPIIATFLCLAHEEAGVTTSTRRTELYAHVVRSIARRAWKEKPLAKADPHVDDLVRFLVCVARPLFERHPAVNLFTHTEITGEFEGSKHLPIPLSALEAQHAHQPMPSPETWPTLLRDELLEAGVLIGAGLRDGMETQFSFAHRSLLEYLVARNLNGDINAKGWASVEQFVDKKSWHPAWQEAVVFLAGLMADPVPLLALLADASTDDMTRQRLCLAGRSLPELDQSQRDLLDKLSEEHPGRPEHIAHEVLKLWWHYTETEAEFGHVTSVLPSVGAACAPVLVPGLLAQTGAGAERMRGKAVEALGRLGPAAAGDDVMSTLVGYLRKGRLQAVACYAVGWLGPAAATREVIESLAHCLQADVLPVQSLAAEAVGKIGLAAGIEIVLSALTDCLFVADVHGRGSAIQAILWLGADALDFAVVRLTDRLRDPEWHVRSTAAEALGKLGSPAASREVLARLTECMSDPEGMVCFGAAEALARLGRVTAFDTILGRRDDWLYDPAGCPSADVAETVGRLGSTTAFNAVMLSLIEFFRRIPELDDFEEELRARLTAIRAMGRLGPKATTDERVLTLLTDCLGDSDGEICGEAAEALGRLGSCAPRTQIVGLLTDLLRDRRLSVRYYVVEALGSLGTSVATDSVLAGLVSRLNDPDEDVRCQAARVFAKMGPTAARAFVVESLTKSLDDSSIYVGNGAAEALGRLGGLAGTTEVVARLTNSLRDPNSHLHLRAAEALGRLGRHAATPEVVGRLAQWLWDPKCIGHSIAVEALGSFVRSGVRWFESKTDNLRVATVAELSGEQSAPSDV